MVFLGFQLELKISTTEQLVLFDEILKICVSSLLLENSKDQAEVVSQDNKREREKNIPHLFNRRRKHENSFLTI